MMSLCRSAVGNRCVIAGFGACVPLAWATDLLIFVGQEFLPVCQPAHGAGDGKQDREH